MSQAITGSVINKVKFDIDSKSWQNLNRFQKRLGDLKKQMAGLSGNIKVNAVVGQIEKVSRAVEQSSKRATKAMTGGVGLEMGKAKGLDRTYASWWEDALKARDKAYREVSRRNESSRSKTDPAKNAMDIRQQTLARLNPSGGQSRLSAGRSRAFDAQFQSLTSQYLSGATSLKVFRSQVNSLTADLLRQERQARSTAMGMGDIRSSLIQMTAAYTGFSVAANVFNTGKEFDSLTASMKLFAKDDAGVKAEMKFISDEAERLGINFQEAASQYTKFSIVARNKLSEEDRKGLFTGFSEYATVLQVDQYRFSRGMMALQQMLSKSKLSSEELRLNVASPHRNMWL